MFVGFDIGLDAYEWSAKDERSMRLPSTTLDGHVTLVLSVVFPSLTEADPQLFESHYALSKFLH